MVVAASRKTLTVALIGNPNTGKSTLFSALAGVRQRVGNYPGVTVEKKLGQTEFHGQRFLLVDLPGTYSLAPRAPDEMVAVDVLLGRMPDVPGVDVVLCIVDASNLERNLYLVSQVLELGLPTVIALNMVDIAQRRGLQLDLARLQRQLPVPCVPIQAHRGIGLEALKAALVQAAAQPPPALASPFPPAFVAEVEALAGQVKDPAQRPPRYLLERLLLDTSGYLARAGLPGVDAALVSQVEAARRRLADAGLPVPGVEAMARYGWAARVLEGVVSRPAERPQTFSDRLDAVLTHRLWGTLVFALVMLLMFQAVFLVAEPASALIDGLNGLAGEAVAALVPPGMLRSLLITGVLGGVGSVVVFLPQIFVLFFFIAVLEDCGYMARAAFLMDRLMAQVGLSGKSFIPLLSSFACAVPGIMATRVIEDRRNRLATILIAPLMSCSARLPVYTLLIGAFVPDRRLEVAGVAIPWLHALVMLAMYSVGIVAAVGVAWLLRRTLFRGPAPPFVMELPSYKLPGWKVVLLRMLEQGWAFLYRAGTLILAVAIVVWALGYFPHDVRQLDPELRARQAAIEQQLQRLPPGTVDDALRAAQTEVQNEMAAQYLAASFLGRMGRWLEPAVRPLGWDWRIGCAAIASFPAREVVIATLGVIYNLGEEQDESSEALQQTLRAATWEGTDRPVFNLPVALSLMVFFALCAQCGSTLVIIRRETGSWGWSGFTFVYMTTLAYLAALATYQLALRWLPL